MASITECTEKDATLFEARFEVASERGYVLIRRLQDALLERQVTGAVLVAGWRRSIGLDSVRHLPLACIESAGRASSNDIDVLPIASVRSECG